MKLLLVILIIYLIGFGAIFLFHMMCLQMVTFPLAFLRALVWPIYVLTGWPHGVPLTMD